MWYEAVKDIGQLVMTGGGVTAMIYLYLNRHKFKAEARGIEAEAKSINIKGELAITGEWQKFAETLKDNVEKLTARVNKLEEKDRAQQKEIAEQRGEIRALRNETQKQEIEIAELRSENTKLGMRCEELEKENKELRRRE